MVCSKVLAGSHTNFFLTSKASDEDGDFVEPYMFKWTALLVPTTILIIIINLVGVTAGVSNAINNDHQSWGPFFGMLFLAFLGDCSSPPLPYWSHGMTKPNT